MKSISNSVRMSYNEQGLPELTLTLTTDKHQALTDISKLKLVIADKKLLTVEINQYRKAKSLDANRYLWVLCQKIAEVIGSTKELVYQDMIRTVGQFAIVPIKEDAVETWITRWNGRGLGWYAEVMDDSKLDGYKKVISYYGSSVYLQNEMSVLINEVVRECKELDIETITENEKLKMIAEWRI